MLLGLSLIGYGVGEAHGEGFRGRNPATGETRGPRYCPASALEIDHAITLADHAASRYAALGGGVHGAFLRGIAERLEALADELAALVPQETGLPEVRVRGELTRTCGQLRLFAAQAEAGDWVDARIEQPDAARKPLPKPDTRSMLHPIGPVAVFGASNFPLAFSVAGGDTASALAVGCPVVVKAHPAHPATSEMVGSAIVEAARALDLPEGVFSLLFDDGIEVGRALVRHPGIRAVGFTGSLRAGRALMDLAAARPEPIPVYAEMGSANPVLILPDALASRAESIADTLAAAVLQGNGQFCTCPGLIIALGSVGYERLRARLAEKLAEAPAAPMLTAGIAAAFRDGAATLSAQPGVASLIAPRGDMHLVSPMLLETEATALLHQPALAHELFGPSTLLVRCPDRDTLMAVLASLEGQLTATVHADQAELSFWPELLPLLARKAGRVLYSGVPTGVEVGHAMVHGGPYPASSDGRSTSVGSAAMLRFARPVCYQGWPDAHLPPALQDANPMGIWRLVNGERRRT